MLTSLLTFGAAGSVATGIGELHDQVLGRPETSSEREVESGHEITRRPLYVSGPGVGRSVLDLDDDDPNFQLDEFDRNQGGIDFERWGPVEDEDREEKQRKSVVTSPKQILKM